MNKPESLRAHLLASVPQLNANPDHLMVFIDEGKIRSTAAPGLSFEYAYTLNVILTDFPGHPDAVAIPLLAWVLVNQRELIENHERNKDAITFEADVLDHSKVDLSIKLALTERVIVKKQDDNTLTVTHPDEPQLEPYLPAGNWQLYGNGEILAEWESTARDGVDIASPHPVHRG
ncbi:phage tail protein [Pseudomonas leptonychotis]|uniref:Phage tail protein n=1 Tax=Pseudomonas leptonychotis TaxID=2448482 RepID=A0A4T2A1D4_9PSED|nr:phage tail protein [Pseudomonas leptonychotis]TIH10833.1 phage tail protein [Pseudomonas leptonychotis]